MRLFLFALEINQKGGFKLALYKSSNVSVQF